MKKTILFFLAGVILGATLFKMAQHQGRQIERCERARICVQTNQTINMEDDFKISLEKYPQTFRISMNKTSDPMSGEDLSVHTDDGEEFIVTVGPDCEMGQITLTKDHLSGLMYFINQFFPEKNIKQS